MKPIFDYSDYKDFLNDWVANQPSNGHGMFRKIAIDLKMHPTLISQIFRGADNQRHLSIEQACDLSVWLKLAPAESEFFIKLVELCRSGTKSAQTVLRSQLERLRKEFAQIQKRVVTDRDLSEQDRAVFYSNAYYAVVRNLLALKGMQTESQLSEALHLPREKIHEICLFLIQTGLAVYDDQKHKMQIGPKSTHVPKTSPFATQHHKNFRLFAIQKIIRGNDEKQLAFTAPLTCSHKDADWFRGELLNLIERLSQRVANSPSEVAMGLNLDWYSLLDEES